MGMATKLIAFGSDHGGLELKQALKSYVESMGWKTADVGTNTTESCDAQDFSQAACKKVLGSEADFAIVICRSGQMTNMAANRLKGIRSALCTNEEMARLARDHNDANVLSLGADIINGEMAKKIAKTFLDTPFSGEDRFIRRNKKLDL